MKLYLPLILTICLAACTGNDKTRQQDEDNEPAAKVSAEPSKITEVTVIDLQPSDFNHEVVSNGHVTGHNRADLFFPSGENLITEVYVKNGQSVSKGQRIAALDTYKLRADAERAKNTLDKAELELKDALIGQGYDPDNLNVIPADVMKLARLRSGYAEAETNLAEAEHKLAEAVLTAPFSGTVANLTAKPFNRPDASKPVCTVIGGAMDVEFKILESELAVVSQGDKVEIKPFSTTGEYSGHITEINPFVDADGLVTVTASADGGKGLYDGMNVKVSVRKSLGKQLVVPKSAVVLRTGKQVVFTLSDDGKKAVWNYVKTGLENMGNYSVADGLEPGMKVIVSGNMNLAHESPVTVR